MSLDPRRLKRAPRRRGLAAVTLALATAVATLAAPPVSAEPTTTPNATFSDDFERPDGEVGNGWVERRGTWRIVTGEALQSTGPLDSIIEQSSVRLGRDWQVDSDLRVEAGPNGDGRNWVGVAGNVRVAANGSLSYYLLRMTTAARTGNPNVARWGMFKVTNSTSLQSLAEGTFTGPASAAGHEGVNLALEREGDQLRGVISDPQGTVVAERSVTLPNDPTLVGGGAGLYSNTANLRATNFSLATTTPELTPPGPLKCDEATGSYEFDPDGNEILDTSELGMTWAGMYVLQDLLTRGDRQYVGFYDVDRNLVVAQRSLPDGEWRYKVLDERIQWDSHNYISLGLDRDGALHVSGNMHNVRLKYFKTETSGDIDTLTRQEVMVDSRTENSVTYPEFVNRQDGSLVFNHRNGGSGSGVTYFNVYDEETGSWSRLVDQPFFNGNGSATNPTGTWNSYFQGPTLGPDGMFHLVWVWRDTPDAATNSMLTYAKSEDLVNWVDATGRPLTTPFRYGEGDVVDPIPEREGLLNGNHKIGFTEDDEILISYHKYDEEGHSQLYTATPQGEDWKLDQISDWTGRWAFGGGGTLIFEVQMLGSEVLSDGNVQVNFLCNGSRQSIVVDDDQQPLAQLPTPALPGNLSEIRTDYPGMQVNVSRDRGDGAEPATDRGRYLLRWETLPENRDLPRSDWPRDGAEIEVVLIGSEDPLTVTNEAELAGTRVVGQKLVGTPATFSDPDVDVENFWLIDDERVPAGSTSLLLGEEHVGSTIGFVSVASREGGDDVTSAAAPVGPVLAELAVETEATLDGEPVAGEELRASPATFTGDEANQRGVWLVDGVATNVEGLVFALTREHIGAVVSYRSFATRDTGGFTETAESIVASAPIESDVVDPDPPVRPPVDPDPPVVDPPAGPGDRDTGIVDGADTVLPGQSVTIDIGSEHAGRSVRVVLVSASGVRTDLGTFTVGEDGTFEITIPRGLGAGTYSLRVEDPDSGELLAEQEITVSGLEDAGVRVGSGSELPAAGAGSSSYLAPLGLLMLLVGVATVMADRRRKRSA